MLESYLLYRLLKWVAPQKAAQLGNAVFAFKQDFSGRIWIVYSFLRSGNSTSRNAWLEF